MRVETQTVKAMTMLRAFIIIMERETIYYGLGDEYGISKIWGMALNAVTTCSMCPLIYHLEGLGVRHLLGNLTRRYLLPITRSNIFVRIYAPLAQAVMNQSTRYGYARSFYFKKMNMRINIMENLNAMANDGTIQINIVEQMDPGPYEAITIPRNIRSWARDVAVMYRINMLTLEHFSEIRVRLKFTMEDKVIEDTSFHLRFTYLDRNRRFSDIVFFSPHRFGMLKSTSNEIRTPDHIANLGVMSETIALRAAHIRYRIMSLDDYIASSGEFTYRTTELRDSGASSLLGLAVISMKENPPKKGSPV